MENSGKLKVKSGKKISRLEPCLGLFLFTGLSVRFGKSTIFQMVCCLVGTFNSLVTPAPDRTDLYTRAGSDRRRNANTNTNASVFAKTTVAPGGMSK
jgi:hypothetical protein